MPNFRYLTWISRSLRSEGQVPYSVLERLIAPSVVVAKYEDNTSINKKVMIKVLDDNGIGNIRGNDDMAKTRFFFQKSRAKNYELS